MAKWILSVTFLLSVADAAIDLKKEITSLPSINRKGDLGDVKADLILIDFWASWCEPCKESFPYYAEQIKLNKKKKVALISISLDDKLEKAEAFLKPSSESHLALWDEKKKLMGLLEFVAIPHLLVLDGDWKVIDTIKGFNTKTKKKLKSYF